MATTDANIPGNVLEQTSAYDLEETVDRLTAAIEAAGMRLFARIDHAAGAQEVGLSMPPTLLLLYGHARGGTPIMMLAPRAGLDLPLRLLVRVDSAGRTLVAFHPIVPMLADVGVPEQVAARLVPAQALILKVIHLE